MKKPLLTLFIALGAASIFAFGQTSKAPDPKTEAQLIALEKGAWAAWKSHDAAWLQANLAPEAVLITPTGSITKAYYLKTSLPTCQVERYALSNFKVTMLDANAAQLTYKATQSAVCNGTASTPTVLAVANYVRRGGKWLEILYMETPAK